MTVSKAGTSPARAPRTTDQAKRFIEAAREAGCSEDEAEIRENMKRIASAPVAKIEKPKT